VSLKKVFFAAAVSIAAVSVNVPAQEVLPVNSGRGYLERPLAIAERSNLYCAGYVQSAPINTSMQLVGGLEEQEQYIYAQNNFVYINAASGNPLVVGDTLAVVRPRGKASSKFSKKDNLGFFVQEVGAVEVVRVKPGHAIARIKTSCDNFLLGDVVLPIPERTSPLFKNRAALDRFRDASGKAVGRLFMSRDGAEMITRDNVVYVDLGAEDNVKVGDYLTVFRPLGGGNLLMPNESETTSASSYGNESDQYRGGQFSNQSSRRSENKAGGSPVSQKKAKSNRPDALRKVVGELVVINVKERTATAVVVRTGQEIHTGDWVEVQ